MNHSNLVKAFKKTNEIIKEVVASKKAYMIDPSKTMSGKSVFFNDQVHTTDVDSYQLAKVITEDLFKIIKRKN